MGLIWVDDVPIAAAGKDIEDLIGDLHPLLIQSRLKWLALVV